MRKILLPFLLLSLSGCAGNLYKAALFDDPVKARALLAKGASPADKNSVGMTAWSTASLSSKRVQRVFVEYCVKDHSPVEDCKPALKAAVAIADPKLVGQLLAKGAVPDSTHLSNAAIAGNVRVLRAVISSYEKHNGDRPLSKDMKNMLLHNAATHNHLKMIDHLLSIGADARAAIKLGQGVTDKFADSTNKFMLSLLAKIQSGIGILTALAPPEPAAAAPAPVAAPAPAPLVRSRPARQRRPATPYAIVTPLFKQPERAHDFALVVGIEDYSDLPDAKFAERDAEAAKRHFLALGVPERNMIYLTGSRATRSSMAKYLRSWLPRNVHSDSRVYFYFSGHGAPDPLTGETYLMPWNGDANFLEDTAYPVKTLYKRLEALKAWKVIVALDACFTGAGGRSVLADGARPLVTRTKVVRPRTGKMTVFAAASANEITATLNDRGHGIFTYYFLKGLSSARNASGEVTADTLYKYLKPKVQDAARRQNREQTPTLQNRMDFVIHEL